MVQILWSPQVDQGGGKRPGAFAIYLEPWHADVFDVLNLKKNHGKEEQRARDLFYALWIPDLFMKRVEEDGVWSLMCPHQCQGLTDVSGAAFEELYAKYEKEGRYTRQVRARDLWCAIVESQIETGTPYMLYKDAANQKSNQQNLGTIQSSNLCTEIIQYTDKDEVAVCNLASLYVWHCYIEFAWCLLTAVLLPQMSFPIRSFRERGVWVCRTVLWASLLRPRSSASCDQNHNWKPEQDHRYQQVSCPRIGGFQ